MTAARSDLPPALALAGPEAPPMDRAEALARYVRRKARFVRAESASILTDGAEAFGEMLAAIELAGVSVDLETYILRADGAGGRFQQALIAAAGRGVRVRLLYDWVGCLGLPERFVRPMLEAGVAVRVYHPLAWLRPSWAVNRRNHRKVLVVDGAAGFTGGLNIGDEYAAIAEGGKGWRDTHVRLDGPEPSAALAMLFESDWRHSVPFDKSLTRRRRLAAGLRRRLRGGLHLPRRRRPGGAEWACRQGGLPAQILGNQEFRFRWRIHRAYLHAINRAGRYVLIENAYFIPDRHIRRALVKAARRGATVAVVVSRPDLSDVPLAAWAGRKTHAALLAGGVRLYEWPRCMMHAKTAVVDDAWAIVGSYNFDHRSLLHQLEAAAVVIDGGFARELRDLTLADIARCRELTLAEHRQRPWHDRLLEQLAWWVRYWL